jgi:hypothetical protein
MYHLVILILCNFLIIITKYIQVHFMQRGCVIGCSVLERGDDRVLCQAKQAKREVDESMHANKRKQSRQTGRSQRGTRGYTIMRCGRPSRREEDEGAREEALIASLHRCIVTAQHEERSGCVNCIKVCTEKELPTWVHKSTQRMCGNLRGPDAIVHTNT